VTTLSPLGFLIPQLIVAVAAEGYLFVEWIGDVGTIADVNATITMNDDYAITANFLDPKKGNPCDCG